ncbi:MAG: hypothetical protein K2W82_19775 [Candidatus Obscuribacterales bacterium]|nr:hypothetical protein [Candidatus Obscuribacterales bacterium]
MVNGSSDANLAAQAEKNDISSGAQSERDSSQVLLEGSGAWAKAKADQTNKVDVMEGVAQAPAVDLATNNDSIFDKAFEADENDESYIEQIGKVNSPQEKSQLYHQKADSHRQGAMEISSFLQAKDAKLHPKYDERKTVYRDQMQKAINDYQSALTVMDSQNANIDMATKAMLNGDMGLAELLRADSVSDNDAKNAGAHFQKAVHFWGEFDPNKEQNSDKLSALKNEALKVVLEQSKFLYSRTGNVDDYNRAEEKLAKLQNRQAQFVNQ